MGVWAETVRRIFCAPHRKDLAFVQCARNCSCAQKLAECNAYPALLPSLLASHHSLHTNHCELDFDCHQAKKRSGPLGLGLDGLGFCSRSRASSSEPAADASAGARRSTHPNEQREDRQPSDAPLPYAAPLPASFFACQLCGWGYGTATATHALAAIRRALGSWARR